MDPQQLVIGTIRQLVSSIKSLLATIRIQNHIRPIDELIVTFVAPSTVNVRIQFEDPPLTGLLRVSASVEDVSGTYTAERSRAKFGLMLYEKETVVPPIRFDFVSGHTYKITGIAEFYDEDEFVFEDVKTLEKVITAP